MTGGGSGMAFWEETPGQTKDTLERLYLLAALGRSRCTPGGIGGSGWGEEHLDFPAQVVAPATWTRISSRKRTYERTSSANYPGGGLSIIINILMDFV